MHTFSTLKRCLNLHFLRSAVSTVGFLLRCVLVWVVSHMHENCIGLKLLKNRSIFASDFGCGKVCHSSRRSLFSPDSACSQAWSAMTHKLTIKKLTRQCHLRTNLHLAGCTLWYFQGGIDRWLSLIGENLIQWIWRLLLMRATFSPCYSASVICIFCLLDPQTSIHGSRNGGARKKA